MATIDQFTRVWKRTSDNPQGNPLDQDILPNEATLLIGIAADTSQCHVVWHDGKGTCWCISNLTFRNGILEGVGIPRSSVDDASQRSVTLKIEEIDGKNVLLGDINAVEGSGMDGPVGTFTAEAQPHPVGEERIAA